MKRLTAIRNAKTWQEQLALAEGKTPGSEFEALLKSANAALDRLERMKPPIRDFQELVNASQNNPSIMGARQSFERLGICAARLFKENDSFMKRDPIRSELIALNGMFPAGKPRLENVAGKIVEQEPWPKLSVRIVLANLKKKGVGVGENTKWLIRRYAKELKIPLDSTPGRPSAKNTDKKH